MDIEEDDEFDLDFDCLRFDESQYKTIKQGLELRQAYDLDRADREKKKVFITIFDDFPPISDAFIEGLMGPAILNDKNWRERYILDYCQEKHRNNFIDKAALTESKIKLKASRFQKIAKNMSSDNEKTEPAIF